MIVRVWGALKPNDNVSKAARIQIDFFIKRIFVLLMRCCPGEDSINRLIIFYYFSKMLSAGNDKMLQDNELIRRYKESGELAILGELYKRYMTLVYGVCLKYLKDREESRDMVMQLFEKLVSTVAEHEITHFKSWLYVTARNQCLMLLRSKKGKNFEEISPFLMESNPSSHPEEEQEFETNLSKLERCIGELGEEQKHCVQLFYLQQKCYKEVTEITGFDFNKVKSFIQNGKRNLKLCMERNE
jgi:RNA polymerase sigma-70 factor (ECF subfamily)